MMPRLTPVNYDPFAGDGAQPDGRLRITVTPRDRDLAIRTVLGEAANEPDEGQAAVAAVIRNRAQGGDLAKVILAPNQFEPWNTQQGRSRMFSYAPDSEPYKRAAAAVDRVFGEGYDPTQGATHFFSPTAQAALGRQPPSWAQGEGQPIGRHTFYAPEGRVQVAQAGGAASPGRDVAAATGQPRLTPVDYDPFAQPEAAPQPAEGAGRSREPAPDMGRLSALGAGARSGAMFGFPDELAGLQAASGGVPDFAGLPTGKLVALARLGYEALAGRGKATEAYETARDTERQALETAREQYPGTTLTGELLGGVAVPIPGAAAVRGAGMLGRMAGGAAVGAGAGALAGAGEGEDLASRASGAASGLLVGGGIGAGVPVVGKGLELAGQGIAKVAQPITQAFRGVRDVDAEAARRIATAQQADLAKPTSRSGLTQAEFEAAQRGGQPVVVGDIGGENVRALARSAADTSPSGREALEAVVSDRFKTQSPRTAQFLNDTFKFPTSPEAIEKIEATARAQNKPAYIKAYNAGDREIWSPELERLTAAPYVQSALGSAISKWKNYAVRDGYGAANPPFRIENGGLIRTGGGMQAYPNIQLWDYAARELQDAARAAPIGSQQGKLYNDLARLLKNELDGMVPEYKAAREGAAKFFGEERAVEAGGAFAKMSGLDALKIGEARKALANMKPAERELFEAGFLSNIVAKVESLPEGADLVKRIYNSDFAKKQIELVVGKDRAALLEAHLLKERAMRLLDESVRGNSKTSQYLMQQGLAGGAQAVTGASLYAAATGNLDYGTALAGGLTAWGGRKIDARVAKRVGEMLASNDPAILKKGLNIVARNDNMKRALRAFEVPGARVGGQQSPPIPALQSMGTGRAENE